MTIHDQDKPESEIASRISRIKETFAEARNAGKEPETTEPKPDWFNGTFDNFYNTPWGNWCNLKT
jgi:hypothetical protein